MSGARAYDGARRALWVGATALVLLGSCGDDADEPTVGEARAEQLRTALAVVGLPGDVVDVLALAAAGTAGTYTVTYELGTTDGDTQELVLTQRPPQRRLDITNADGTADATISTGGALHQCHLAGTWTCSEIAATDDAAISGVLDAAAVESLGRSLAESIDRYDLTVEHRDVIGVDATCLLTELRAGLEPAAGEATSGALCISPEGAVLMTERPDEVLTAVAYEPDVADDAFDLPG